MKCTVLRDVLLEYPPSKKLKIFEEGKLRFEMSIAQMASNLMAMPDGQAEIFGKATFIIRERIDTSGSDAILPEHRMWVELDARS